MYSCCKVFWRLTSTLIIFLIRWYRVCYQIVQMSFICKATLSYILLDSCNNVYKDIMFFHSLCVHQILLQQSTFRTYCEGDFSRFRILQNQWISCYTYTRIYCRGTLVTLYNPCATENPLAARGEFTIHWNWNYFYYCLLIKCVFVLNIQSLVHMLKL